jgi:hypothetical protein
MSQSFIINAKVIFSGIAAVAMLVLGIAANNWVKSEQEFKDKVIRKQEQMIETLHQIQLSDIRQEGRMDIEKLTNDNQERRIKYIVSSLNNSGISIYEN